MDEDLIRLREKQIKEQQKQVLPKPNIDNNNAVKQGNLFQGIDNKTIKGDILYPDSKGQLISKCPFGGVVSTKIPTKKFDNFCPRNLKRGQIIR